MKINWVLVSIVCIILACTPLVSCVYNMDVAQWQTVVCTEDTELGDGAKTVIVEVKDNNDTVVFTIHTDAVTVGEALSEHKLIAGEEGAYGMYIKAVNGIVADYATDQSYWAFYKDGQYMQTGVDKTEFKDGERFELVKEAVE